MHSNNFWCRPSLKGSPAYERLVHSLLSSADRFLECIPNMRRNVHSKMPKANVAAGLSCRASLVQGLRPDHWRRGDGPILRGVGQAAADRYARHHRLFGGCLLFIPFSFRTDLSDSPCLLTGVIATARHIGLGRDFRITPLAGFCEALAILGMLRQKTAASICKSFLLA